MNCPRCGNVFDDNTKICPACKDYYQVLSKADIKKRYGAALIDATIVFICVYFHAFTAIFGAVYLLFRDNITRNGSLGKLVFRLNIVDINKRIIADKKQRIARNFFLACGFLFLLIIAFFEIIPLVGLLFLILRYAVMALFFIFVALETIYIWMDEKGQHFSDRMAKTMVV
ncbi:MAG: hypothetical protein ACQESP_00460 [Candidatus Muiribacteriota bacterium]